MNRTLENISTLQHTQMEIETSQRKQNRQNEAEQKLCKEENKPLKKNKSLKSDRNSIIKKQNFFIR